MDEKGVQTIFHGWSMLEFALIARQRCAAGYNWPIQQIGTPVNPDIFINISRFDAAKGM